MNSKIKLDFIVLGAHRCGTTWLHENLYHHPEIVLSKSKKELHFFDRKENYNRGVNFYNDYFKIQEKNKLYGEVTPSYLSTINVPERIKFYFPKAKFIVMLRNPIERLYSHYKLNCGNHNIKESFSNYYNRKPIEKEEGRYIDYIQNYLKHFKKEQFLFLIFDELASNPLEFYRKILDFLDVNDKMYKPRALNTKSNSWQTKKHNLKNNFIYYTIRVLKRLKYFNLSTKLENIIQKKNIQSYISTKDKNILNDYYRESITELESFLDIELINWKVNNW